MRIKEVVGLVMERSGRAIYKGWAVKDGVVCIRLPDGTKRAKRTFPSKMEERIRIYELKKKKKKKREGIGG